MQYAGLEAYFMPGRSKGDDYSDGSGKVATSSRNAAFPDGNGSVAGVCNLDYALPFACQGPGCAAQVWLASVHADE